MPSPGGQVSGMGRAIPSTSQRATTQPPMGRAWQDQVTHVRGCPQAGRAVGLRQVDGMALARIRGCGESRVSLGARHRRHPSYVYK